MSRWAKECSCQLQGGRTCCIADQTIGVGVIYGAARASLVWPTPSSPLEEKDFIWSHSRFKLWRNRALAIKPILNKGQQNWLHTAVKHRCAMTVRNNDSVCASPFWSYGLVTFIFACTHIPEDSFPFYQIHEAMPVTRLAFYSCWRQYMRWPRKRDWSCSDAEHKREGAA